MTKAEAAKNGEVEQVEDLPIPMTLHLTSIERDLLNQMLEQVNFPTAFSKQVAASLQGKLETMGVTE